MKKINRTSMKNARKKALAGFLAVMLLFSSVSVYAVAEAAPLQPAGASPRASTAATWAEVAGKAVSPADYEWDIGRTTLTVQTAAGLAWAANQTDPFTGKTILLANDIDLASGLVTDYDSGTITATNSWVPLGSRSGAFDGMFDGQNHTVSGVKINNDLKNQGLIGAASGGAVIRNVGVVNSSITANNYAGGIVGNSNALEISNCYNTGSVTVTAASAGYVGGVVGCLYSKDANTHTIKNCYNTGVVKANARSYVGGIIGLCNGVVINCYSAAPGQNDAIIAGAGSSAGGIVGWNYNQVENCYSTSAIMTLVGTNFGGVAGFSAGTVKNCAYLFITAKTMKGIGDEPDSPTTAKQMYSTEMRAAAFAKALNANLEAPADPTLYTWQANTNAYPTLTNSLWQKSIPATWQELGAAAIPDVDYSVSGNIYTIKTAPGLAWAAKETANQINDFKGKTVVLANNINLQGGFVADYDNGPITATNSWTPIGSASFPFKGTFDGGGYTVSGVKITNQQDHQGLFGYVQGAAIQNVAVGGSAIAARDYVGGVVGTSDASVIESCSNGGSITASGANGAAGGVCGQTINSQVKNCFGAETGAITGAVAVGGVAGRNDGTSAVLNCYNTSALAGDTPAAVGGVVGDNSGKIVNCYSTAAMTGTATALGGIAGKNDGTVSLCYYGNGFVKLGLGGTASDVAANTLGMADGDMKLDAFAATLNANLNVQRDDTLYTWEKPSTYPDFTNSLWQKTLATTWKEVGEAAISGTDYSISGSTYTIKTAAGLAWAANETAKATSPESFDGKLVVLGNSINLEAGLVTDYDNDTISDTNSWIPIGNSTTPFKGTFDGKGFTVSGVKIQRPTQDNQGLFGSAQGAIIQNLGILKSAVTAQTNIGSVVGYLDASSVLNCYSAGGVTAKGANAALGGVAGQSTAGSAVTNCYATGWVIASASGASAGRVVGQNLGTVAHCYYLAGAGTEQGIGTVTPDDPAQTLSMAADAIKDEAFVAALNGNLDGLKNGALHTWCKGTDGPMFTAAQWAALPNTWAEVAAKAALGTDYSIAGDTYTIKTAAGLAWVANETAKTTSPNPFDGKTIVLAGDINLTDRLVNNYDYGALTAINSWIPIGNETTQFAGTFDGANHTVNGVKIKNDQENQGLFGSTQGATIQNVAVTNADITAKDNVGGVVGACYGGAVIGCSGAGAVEGFGAAAAVGGVIGLRNAGTVTGCSNMATVKASQASAVAGGVIGFNLNSIVKASHNAGQVEASGSKAYVGGVIGGQGGVIGDQGSRVTAEDCYNTGRITANGDGSRIGGVIGYNFTGNAVTKCYNTGAIIASGTGDAVGGVVGYNRARVINCYNEGIVNGGSAVRIGGVVGWNYTGIVTNCYNTASVNGPAAVNMGGVVGQNAAPALGTVGKVANCYNTGKVSGSAVTNIGGVAGLVGGNDRVALCYYLEGTAAGGMGDGTADIAGNTLQMTDAAMKDAAFVATLNTNVTALRDSLYNWQKTSSYPILDTLVAFTPKAGDFDFAPPAKPMIYYDGTGKEAFVTAKAAAMGAVTVKYYDSTGAELLAPPVTPGVYTAKIDVAAGAANDAATDLTDPAWTFTITPKELDVVTLAAVSRDYNGTSDVVLTGGRLFGAVKTDSVSASMPTAGRIADPNAAANKPVTVPLITLSGPDAFKYTLKQPPVIVSITAKQIPSAIDAIADQLYTGRAIEPLLTVRDGNAVLIQGKDYTVAYTNNVNGSTATATVTGMGNYKGSAGADFWIIHPFIGGAMGEPFSDVNGGDWFYYAVNAVYRNRLFLGTSPTIFSPDDGMTRAMLWTVFYRMAGSPNRTDFPSSWYADAQRWAIAEKISNGENPDQRITREQLATMFYRYANAKATTADMSAFTDRGAISDFAKDSMQWAVANKLLQGHNGKLNPKANATRAETAAMFQRFIDIIR